MVGTSKLEHTVRRTAIFILILSIKKSPDLFLKAQVFNHRSEQAAHLGTKPECEHSCWDSQRAGSLCTGYDQVTGKNAERLLQLFVASQDRNSDKIENGQ